MTASRSSRSERCAPERATSARPAGCATQAIAYLLGLARDAKRDDGSSDHGRPLGPGSGPSSPPPGFWHTAVWLLVSADERIQEPWKSAYRAHTAGRDQNRRVTALGRCVVALWLLYAKNGANRAGLGGDGAAAGPSPWLDRPSLVNNVSMNRNLRPPPRPGCVRRRVRGPRSRRARPRDARDARRSRGRARSSLRDPRWLSHQGIALPAPPCASQPVGIARHRQEHGPERRTTRRRWLRSPAETGVKLGPPCA